MSGEPAVADTGREVRHAVEDGMDLGDDVHAVDDDRCVARRAQRHVQDGAPLADVDLGAAEHGVDARAQLRFIGERDQQVQRLVGHALLRVVEEEAGGLGGEALAAAGIRREEPPQMGLADRGGVTRERLPCGKHRERRAGAVRDRGAHGLLRRRGRASRVFMGCSSDPRRRARRRRAWSARRYGRS